MLRGQQQLFTTLFPSSVSIDPQNKGKRNVLIEQRDKVMACRYFFYAQIRRQRYDDCLAALELEFFIKASVIVQRLTEKQAFLKEMVANEETLLHLKREFPQFSWNTK